MNSVTSMRGYSQSKGSNVGLYLCVFDDADEIDGMEVGSYQDFDDLRREIRDRLGGDDRFPTLLRHSDCDGEWNPAECSMLETELKEIIVSLKGLPPQGVVGGWQRDVINALSLRPRSRLEELIDVDGEPLLERLLGLTQLAQREQRSILFQ